MKCRSLAISGMFLAALLAGCYAPEGELLGKEDAFESCDGPDDTSCPSGQICVMDFNSGCFAGSCPHFCVDDVAGGDSDRDGDADDDDAADDARVECDGVLCAAGEICLMDFNSGCTYPGCPRHCVADGPPVDDGINAATEEAIILLVTNRVPASGLRDVVGLSRLATSSIVALRPFSTLEELDAAPHVGTRSIEKLLEHGLTLLDNGGDDTQEEQLMVEVANETSLTDLREVVGLSRLATSSIAAYRPFRSYRELEGTPRIGRRTLEKLLDYGLGR